MESAEIREKFLKFMESRGHTIVPSASLLPIDPSVLFTTAGMQQFKPYYMGEESPFGKNVASVQKCVRTSDIDEVGDESHLTFFEMLGNFSFGGYFKKEAIGYAYEFITKELGLEIDYVTVFEDENEKDGESEEIWKEIDREIKIKKSGRKDNFWGPTGDEGPCGPTTEIYINGLEVWNLVFNEYYKNKNGNYEKLKTSGVDTGMGLERIAMVMQGKNNVYETDLLEPIIKKIKSQFSIFNFQSNLNFQFSKEKSTRIIADHIKASVFIIADGVEPSNTGRGYILRRLIRRTVRHGKLLGIEQNFITNIAEGIINLYKNVYSETEEKKENIFKVLSEEESKFAKTLEKGLKELQKMAMGSFGKFNSLTGEEIESQELSITGKNLFLLFSTYGFPFEMSIEELEKKIDSLILDRYAMEEKRITVDLKNELRKEFDEEFLKHQERSRTASAGMFKGGLADAGEQTTKYHTATHLLLAALRQVLGNHVEQKGSNITAERMRFDFSHPQKMTAEEIKKVEDLVNEKILENLPIICEEMSLEEAKAKGATGVFEQKYGERVKIYSIGEFSKEICGGPHVKKTGILGKFRIVKEEASSAGVRRIKAVLE